MREYVVKMVESNGNVSYLNPKGFWVSNRYQSKLYAKNHATRIANIYARAAGKSVITTELL